MKVKIIFITLLTICICSISYSLNLNVSQKKDTINNDSLNKIPSNTEFNNPIIRVRRSADPSPHLWEGKLYMYCSHDMEDAINYSRMDAYHVYSSVDLIN